MIRVAIVEDDREILQSIEKLLSREEGIDHIGSFPSAEAFIKNFSNLIIDVVLMDIGLPGKSGIQAVSELKATNPRIQYIMCTVFDDDEKIFDALCAGATGYILKNSTSADIAEAIRIVHHGGSMMSAPIARKVMQSFQKKTISPEDIQQLNSRQWEVLKLLDQGLRYKEIADQLNLSFETIRTYCRDIYSLLQVHSRTDALNKVFPKFNR